MSSTYKCLGCRERKRMPPYATAGLGKVCSQECIDLARKKANAPKPKQKPSNTRLTVSSDVPPLTRVAVLQRDRGKCRYCGTSTNIHIHHINLKAQGIDHQPHNLVCLCDEHHQLVHTDTRYWRPILLGLIWLECAEGRSLSVRQVEAKVDIMQGTPWERLKAKRKIDRDRNWIWTGATTKPGPEGYGRITYAGKTVCTHILAWELTNGPVPPGMKVLHTCDIPRCFNPAHLFLGTQADNMADMKQKGRERKARGTESPQSKLTDEQVLEIRRRRANGDSVVKLAVAFGVNPSNISHICTGRTWTHLPLAGS